MVYATSPWELTSVVQESIKKGYVPYGQPFNNIERYNGSNSHTVCQAMIKPDILNSLELMRKVMDLHPQLEEHILTNV